jgi:hypothetical protein
MGTRKRCHTLLCEHKHHSGNTTLMEAEEETGKAKMSNLRKLKHQIEPKYH